MVLLLKHAVHDIVRGILVDPLTARSLEYLFILVGASAKKKKLTIHEGRFSQNE